LSYESYKPREDFVFGKGTKPRHGDISHAELLDKRFVAFRSASIDDDCDSHVGKRPKTFW